MSGFRGKAAVPQKSRDGRVARIRSRNAAALLRAAIYNLTIGGAQNGTLARPASNF
jgi:hypothetical protein